MKKTISIPQPLADALCSRLIDGWHLEEAPEETPCTYLVYATEQVLNPQTPMEWLMAIHNEQVFGNLGKTESLPVGAYVGYVKFGEQLPHNKSVWTLGSPEPCYRVIEARLFDMAYNPGDFRVDLPLDRWLPSHIVHIERPSKVGNVLTLPVSEDVYSTARTYGSFIVDLTQEMCDLTLEDEDDEDPSRVIKVLRLVCNNREKLFHALGRMDLFYELDADEEPVPYPSVIVPHTPQFRASWVFKCDRPIE